MSGVGRRAWGQVVLSKNPARSAISKDDLSLAPVAQNPMPPGDLVLLSMPAKRANLVNWGSLLDDLPGFQEFRAVGAPS